MNKYLLRLISYLFAVFGIAYGFGITFGLSYREQWGIAVVVANVQLCAILLIIDIERIRK